MKLETMYTVVKMVEQMPQPLQERFTSSIEQEINDLRSIIMFLEGNTYTEIAKYRGKTVSATGEFITYAFKQANPDEWKLLKERYGYKRYDRVSINHLKVHQHRFFGEEYAA